MAQQQFSFSRLQQVMLTFLILWLGYLAFRAITLQINHFDTYAILNNARLILRGGDYPYELIRPPLLSLVLSVLFLFKSLSMTNLIILARLLAVAIFAGYLLMAYRIFRHHTEKSLALFGVLLLTINPLLIADASLCREDILGSLLASGAIYTYFLWRKDLCRPVWIAVCLAAAALARYNFGPLLVVTIGILEAVRLLKAPRDFRKTGTLIGLITLSGLSAFLVICFIYCKLGVTDWVSSPVFVIKQLWGYLGFLQKQADMFADSKTESLEFLVGMYSWPFLLLAVFGMVAAFKKKREAFVLHFTWLVVFFIFHAFFLAYIEVRYLLIIFIPLYFFILAALEDLLARLSKQTALKAALIVVVLIFPLQLAFKSWQRHQDPIYRTDLERKVSFFAKGLAGDKPVYWIGRFYALHPEDYMLHREDELAFVYHFFGNAVRFFLQEEVIDYRAPVVLSGNTVLIPGILPHIEDGAALIVNPEPADYSTSSMPAKMLPLLVGKARIYSFRKDAAMAGFVSSDIPGARLELFLENNQPKLLTQKLPRVNFEVYAPDAEGEFRSTGLFSPGIEDINVYDLTENVTGAPEIKILTISDIQVFNAPN